MHDACGVVGISFKDQESNNVATSIYFALFALQHRGQEAAGISAHDGKTTRTHRGMGLVFEVFDDAQISLLRGSVGIGHVRYPTTGGAVWKTANLFWSNIKMVGWQLPIMAIWSTPPS